MISLIHKNAVNIPIAIVKRILFQFKATTSNSRQPNNPLLAWLISEEFAHRKTSKYKKKSIETRRKETQPDHLAMPLTANVAKYVEKHQKKDQ